MAPGQRGDAAGDADHLNLDELVDDLDDDEEPPARSLRGAPGSTASRWSRWPAAVPGWARGPAAVVVLVLAAGLGGAAVGSSHRDALDARSALQRALTVGFAFVAASEGRGGDLAAQVHVALVNHGDTALDVRLQGLSTPHQGTTEPPDEVQVDPGELTVAPVAVRVDCAAVRTDTRMLTAAEDGDVAVDPDTGDEVEGAPAQPATSPARPSGAASTATVVLASVRPVGGGTAVDVQLPVVDSIADSIDRTLGQACGASGPPKVQTGWLWQDDGALRVRVTAQPDAQPVRLQLESTAGLGATSDPPLPRDLRPGETAVIDIEVHPRCSVVGNGALSRLDLQAVDGSGATESLGQAFDATTPAAGTPRWLARQVALACG